MASGGNALINAADLAASACDAVFGSCVSAWLAQTNQPTVVVPAPAPAPTPLPSTAPAMELEEAQQ